MRDVVRKRYPGRPRRRHAATRRRSWTCAPGTTGRATAGPTRRRRRSWPPSRRCWPATRTTRARTTSTSTPWRPRSSPRRRRPRPTACSKLMPGAGHMVHMPSHIYQRVGRYADAAASNEAAIKADEDYITPVPRPGPLPDGLLPAQHPLPLVRGHRRGPEPGRDRGRAQDRVRRSTRRAARRAAAAGRLPRRALLRAHPLREVGRDAGGARARRPATST